MNDAMPPIQDAPVAVAFENLDASAQRAEFQKDLLMQVLRERFPDVGGFVEAASGDAPGAAHMIRVTCVKCPRASDATLYVAASAQGFRPSAEGSRANAGDARETVRFRAEEPDGGARQWTIALATGNARYFIGSERGLSPGQPMAAAPLTVLPCDARARCTDANSYPGVGAAQAALGALTVGKAARPVAARVAISSTDIAEPPLVTASGEVRVVYRNAPGTVRVVTRGKALTSGSLGARVRVALSPVFSLSSAYGSFSGNRVVDAIVSGPVEVEYAP